MKIFLTITLLCNSLFAQDGKAILDQVYSRFLSVRDYQADIKIKPEIPFINTLPVEAKLYYKQPDKMKVLTSGIAILPKQGFDQIFKLLKTSDQFTYLKQGEDLVDNISTSIVNVLPNSDTGDVVLSKLWIDTKRQLLVKAQMTTKSSGTVSSEYIYGSYAEYGLCDSIIFSIDVKKFKIPKIIAADLNQSTENQNPKTNASKGKITLYFSNYKINQGVNESVFREK